MSSVQCPICGNYHHGSDWYITKQMQICLENQERYKSPKSEDIALANFFTAAKALELIRAAVEETFGYHHGTDVEPDIMVEAHKVAGAIWEGYNRSTEKDAEIERLTRLLEERTELLSKKTKTIQRIMIMSKRTKIS